MVMENDRRDEDPAEGQGGASLECFQQVGTSKGEYSDLQDLTEKEQKNPIAWKWALRDLSRLREIEIRYLTLKDDYSKLDKEHAVYKAQSMKDMMHDIFASIFLTIGPILIGLVPVAFEMEPKYIRWILLGIGIVMLGGAIFIKCKTYKK